MKIARKLNQTVKGFRTYVVIAAWLAWEWAVKHVYIPDDQLIRATFIAAICGFIRSGSKNDAKKAVEEIKADGSGS
jgi:hypothetical protein